jgi:hypothetical protein
LGAPNILFAAGVAMTTLTLDTLIIGAAILVVVAWAWFAASTLEEHAAIREEPHYRVVALLQLGMTTVAVTVLATYALGAARLMAAVAP